MSHIASYRVQLRDGLDFAGLTRRLPQIADLGVSHLYLSPILTAAPGSTHGYDVTDPTTVDPGLGGLDGYRALATAAREHGLRIILDIVPNHMAFGLDTPWLVDVLRHGQDSDHAPVFDIDWSAGPLALPWLPKPLAEHAPEEITREGDWLRVGDLRLPLHPNTPKGSDLNTILPAQAWQLLPWQLERDSITHRRFFSVTSLIGVRIEDESVFEAAHACVFALADEGLIDGLRVDHVDGLVDPRRLPAPVDGTDGRSACVDREDPGNGRVAARLARRRNHRLRCGDRDRAGVDARRRNGATRRDLARQHRDRGRFPRRRDRGKIRDSDR